MKRKIFNSILAALTVSALVLSCDPIEPASYTENFYRIATVNCVNGKASLKFDYTGENYSIDNFKTQKDLDRFELNHGDRIIAGLQYRLPLRLLPSRNVKYSLLRWNGPHRDLSVPFVMMGDGGLTSGWPMRIL